VTDTASRHAEERAEQLERHKQQHVDLDAELDSDPQAAECRVGEERRRS
jgi:ribosome-associated translation inhibitor RaiA